MPPSLRPPAVLTVALLLALPAPARASGAVADGALPGEPPDPPAEPSDACARRRDPPQGTTDPPAARDSCAPGEPPGKAPAPDAVVAPALGPVSPVSPLSAVSTPPPPPLDASPGQAVAGGGPPASAAGPALPTGPPTSPPPTSPFTPEDTWLDAGHAFVEQRLFSPVLQFDRFFSDERELDAERSRSYIRLRGEVRLRDPGAPVYATTVHATLRLPGLNRWLERLRLDISGESDDLGSAPFPEGGPAAHPDHVGRADAELRYGIWTGLLSRIDLGAGVLFALPPGAFGRVRFRAAIPIDGVLLSRVATSGFYRTDVGFGTSVALGLERPLGPASLARLGGYGELTERSRGVEWSSELALMRAIGPRRAVWVAVGAQGAERSPVAVERYRVTTRLRRDAWRHWVFVELEPEIAWPWTPTDGRFRELAVTLRLELQFRGNEPAEVRPRPTEAAEPADPPDPAPDPAPAPRPSPAPR